LSIETAPRGTAASRSRRALRWALAAWAFAIYVIYWLGYLGLR
jgi:hypothetical protein